MSHNVSVTPEGWFADFDSPSSNGRFSEIDGGIIMQFTGLLDENGKEIYEDDIVKHSIESEDCFTDETVNRQVIFKNGIFGFQCVVFQNNIEYLQSYACISEVIGNIFENPELLNNKE